MNRIFFGFIFFLLGTVAALGQQKTPHVQGNKFANIGQSTDYDGVSFMIDDSVSIALPPIALLIDNARQSAQVLFYDSQKAGVMNDIKSLRRKWLDYIKLTASYQYGVLDSYLMFAESGVAVPPNDRFTNQSQSYYLLGAGIYLPLSEIFDRGNKIKKQKALLTEKDYQSQMWHDDIAIKIIECYTQAMENIAMIKPLLEDYTLSSAQYAVSEVDFVKGQLSIQDLNRQKTLVARSRYELEKNRMTLVQNILKLEVLSNTKIISGKGKL